MSVGGTSVIDQENRMAVNLLSGDGLNKHLHAIGVWKTPSAEPTVKTKKTYSMCSVSVGPGKYEVNISFLEPETVKSHPFTMC